MLFFYEHSKIGLIFMSITMGLCGVKHRQTVSPSVYSNNFYGYSVFPSVFFAISFKKAATFSLIFSQLSSSR